MADKKTAMQKPTRREQKISGTMKDLLLEWYNIMMDDPRQKIRREMMLTRFGKIDMRGERLTPRPAWDQIFKHDACPLCNTTANLNTGKDIIKLDIGETTIVCPKCGLAFTKKTYEEARERNQQEIEWTKKDKKLEEEIRQYKIPPQRAEELSETAEKQVEQIMEQKYGKEPPEEETEVEEETP